MNIDDLVFLVGLVFISIAIVCVAGMMYIEIHTCDDTIEKNVTIAHTFTEMLWGSTTYHFIDTDKNSYYLYGDNQGARFQSLKCNQTYRIATNADASCSEKLMDENEMNYTKLISEMQQLHTSECLSKTEQSKWDRFPFDNAYAGQNEAVETIMREDRSLLCSHTGSGKSAVFLTAAHELDMPTLVIEPRKFLQIQLQEYFNDFVLFGKSEYKCFYSDSAAHAPCAKVYTRNKQKYFSVLNAYTGEIDEKPYPCANCEYVHARTEARKRLTEKGVLIVNMGNFWMWRNHAKFIIVDEADEFFRSISSGIGLYAVTTKDIDDTDEDTTINLLKKEEEDTENKIERIKQKEVIDIRDAKKLNTLNNHLEKILFFQRNKEICFYYTKKTTKQVYVELQPDKINVLVDRLFSGAKLCLVSATPSAFV